MALAAQVKVVDFSRRRKTLRVSITATGNYVLGGDTLSLVNMSNPKFIPGGGFGTIPDDNALIYLPGGYLAEYVPGTTLANGKIKVWTASGAELPAAAYPALLTGNTWEWEFSGKMYSGM